MTTFCNWARSSQVVWQEYSLPPVIRWRYQGEDWNEIEGDDWETEQQKGQCCNLIYRVEISVDLVRFDRDPSHKPVLFNYIREGTNYRRPPTIYGQFLGTSFDNNQKRANGVSRAFNYNWRSCDGVKRTHPISTNSNTSGWLDSSISVKSIEVVGEGIDNCGDCIFTVFKDKAVVHQETRDVCPEVEDPTCRLSDVYKRLEITKQPDIETIEINQNSIPNNCLNIYLKSPEASEFIAQICSSANCPPPEYEVICGNNDCESCPPNTCAIKCGSKVCCYGADGIAVKSIDRDRYCA